MDENNNYEFEPEYPSDPFYEPETEPNYEGKSSPKKQDFIRRVIFISGAVIVALIFILLLTSEPSHKPKRHVPKSSNQRLKIEKTENPPINNPTVLEDALKALVLIKAESRFGRSRGSGFVLDESGHVITNYHVIEEKDQIMCRSHDGEHVSATVVATDPELDLALLKLNYLVGQPTLRWGNSEQLKIGDEVLALGYPLAFKLGDSPSISRGIVSSLRQKDGITWLQIDAAVNPGNSGGPVVKKETNRVYGIVTLKMLNSEGIAFALPSNTCQLFIERSMNRPR